MLGALCAHASCSCLSHCPLSSSPLGEGGSPAVFTHASVVAHAAAAGRKLAGSMWEGVEAVLVQLEEAAWRGTGSRRGSQKTAALGWRDGWTGGKLDDR